MHETSLSENVKSKDTLEDLDADGKIISRSILRTVCVDGEWIYVASMALIQCFL